MGMVALPVEWTEPSATDNVGILLFEANVSSGTNFPADTTTTVTYTAIDLAGNVDTSCSFTVKVVTEGRPVGSWRLLKNKAFLLASILILIIQACRNPEF